MSNKDEILKEVTSELKIMENEFNRIEDYQPIIGIISFFSFMESLSDYLLRIEDDEGIRNYLNKFNPLCKTLYKLYFKKIL